MKESSETPETQKVESTYLGVFSGETKRVDIPALNRLFGPCVPVEAINIFWDAPENTSLADAREAIQAMAKSWDQAKFHLGRVQRAAQSILQSATAATERLSMANETERIFLIQDFEDAADNLECADQDAMFLRRDREE